MKKRTIPVRFTGQHFTIDSLLIQEAIHLAQLQPDDLVLDIGAGRGALTLPLLAHAGQVIAIENDPALVTLLRLRLQRHTGRLTIAGMDFRRFRLPDTPFKVVASIPYRITADILKALMVTGADRFRGGSLIMQLEPARKLTSDAPANPYVVFYRTLYVFRLRCEIAPSSFCPPPTVRSALLSIRRRTDVPLRMDEQPAYLDFLQAALRRPDRPVRKVFGQWFAKASLRKLMLQHRLEPDRPIRRLSPGQFAACFRAYRLLRSAEGTP